MGPAWFERKIARLGIPMVFGFDDAVFVPYRRLPNGYLKFPQKTSIICKISTHVIAGNDYLAEYAKKFNQNINVIPTTIDAEKHKPIGKFQAQSP